MIYRVLIALTLSVSILLIDLLGRNATAGAMQSMEEQQGLDATAQLRSRIETNLHIGLDLADSEELQRQLEDIAARTTALDLIEIDDHRTVLFASDRALRGQPVPSAWLDAMRSNPSEWHAVLAGNHSAAIALRDATGQVAGYLVWTHLDNEGETSPLSGTTFWIAIATGLAAWLALSTRDRRSARTAPADSVALAIDRANTVGEELERVNRDAHSIAGIEP